MEDWRRGSTPINVFIVDRDLRNSKVFVTYSQDGSVIVEKTNDELTITEDQIIVNLSQTDTLNFHEGLIDIQIRFIDDDGYTDASNILSARATRILKDGEIVYA